MKKFYAWLLLTVSTCQWIGGHIYFEVSYFIEIEYRMNEAEKTIAEAVKEETGVEANVKIISSEQLTQRGQIYSDFFAFSENIGDETVYFTISHDSSATTYEKVTHHQTPQQENENAAIQLKSLQQDFIVPFTVLPVAHESELPVSNFLIAELFYLHFDSHLTPPPDFA